MLRSHAICDPVLKPGDFIDVFFKQPNEVRGKWLSPSLILSIDRSDGYLSVIGFSGRSIYIAVEEIWHSIIEDDFAEHFRNGMISLMRP